MSRAVGFTSAIHRGAAQRLYLCAATLCVFAGCVFMWLWLSVQSAIAQQPAGQGVIEGRVVMLSRGSTASLGNLPASLFTYINGARQVPPAVGQTDAQGRVRFENLQTGSNYTYTLIIRFQDSFYRAESVAFAPNSASAQAMINVYDSTADTRALRIEQRHVIIERDTQEPVLNIAEIYLLRNEGDRTIVGAPDSNANNKRVAFRAVLPPGALVDSVEGRQGNEDVFQANNQLLDTLPIPPGEASFIFTYRLPYQRSTVALGFTAPYSVPALSMLVAPNITVRSPRLVAQGSRQMGSRTMQFFAARDLAADSTLAVELGNLPAPLIPLDIAQWAPLVAVTLTLIGVLFWSSHRRRTA